MTESKDKFDLGRTLGRIEDDNRVSAIYEAFAIPKGFGYDGPPCLRALAMNGVPTNGRLATLYTAGVYARKRNPDDWKLAVAHFNLMLIHPPVPHDEVDAIIKRVARKTYRYPCEDNPLRGLCDKDACSQADYGMEGMFSQDGMILGSLRVVRGSVPTTWIIDVNGKDLYLYTEELMSQTAFAERLMEKLYMLMEPMKKDAWRELLAKKLAEVEHVNDDDDVTDNYKFMHIIEQFCCNNPGTRPEDMMVGRVYLNEQGYNFLLKHMTSYLSANGYKNMAPRDLAPALKSLGGTNQFRYRVKKKMLRPWIIPETAFSKNIEKGEDHEDIMD